MKPFEAGASQGRRETRRKKLKFINKHIILFTITLTLAAILNACDDSSGPTITNSSNPLKGAYILYNNSLNRADYAFYDAAKDSVTDFVFSTNNSGINLGVNPGEMKLNSDRKLYVSTLGIPGSAGTIYKIDPNNNNVIDSLRFGKNPYGFAINNNRLVIANFGGSYASILDLDLNIIRDSIGVGSAPRYVLYGFNKYIVSKSAITTENSIALIDESSNLVTKLFYPAAPLSAIYNVNGIFISTSSNKNVYRIETESYTTIDSFSVPTVLTSINRLVFKTQNSFFAVAGGKEVWLVNSGSGTFTFTNIYPASSNISILTASYESNSNELFIAVRDNSTGFNQLIIINGDSGTLKRTKPIAGYGSASIVFRY